MNRGQQRARPLPLYMYSNRITGDRTRFYLSLSLHEQTYPLLGASTSYNAVALLTRTNCWGALVLLLDVVHAQYSQGVRLSRIENFHTEWFPRYFHQYWHWDYNICMATHKLLEYIDSYRNWLHKLMLMYLKNNVNLTILFPLSEHGWERVCSLWRCG